MRFGKLTAFVMGVSACGAAPAWADLASEFSGFHMLASEVGVSGLRSSYGNDTRNGQPYAGATTGHVLAAFGPGRVTYPSGVGEAPSPGGSEGLRFDQGMLGVRLVGDDLVVRVATALNPLTGYHSSAWNTTYAQGDMFLSVLDGDGVHHFALLNSWARDGAGHLANVGGGYFNDAKNFHVQGSEGYNREGHLIELGGDGNIMVTGGPGSYNGGNTPAGLDVRIFAKGGTDLGDANLEQETVTNQGRNWYVQTWTLDRTLLSSDYTFQISLHTAASCGNDQIGGNASVPVPGAALLGLLGVGLTGGFRRR